ncbi:MAG: hypothetical protein WC472_00170 [Candidatus Paceibacterota bacterium]
MADINKCCAPKNKDKSKGVLLGLVYGLIPHTFCIAFILFSVLGTTASISIIKKFLLIPYFFEALIILSLTITVLSSAIYLKKFDLLSLSGLRIKWKYLTLMCLATLTINSLIFFVVFPTVANTNNTTAENYASNLSSGTLKVQIPCSGHAPLIISEIKKENGVNSVFFKMPDTFEIKYNSKITSLEKIISLDIFKNFKTTIQ